MRACFTGGINLLQKKYPECKPVSLGELFFCRRHTPSASLFHWGNYSSAEKVPRVQACFTGGIILLQKKYPECEPVSLGELFFCRKSTPSARLFHWGNYSSAEKIPRVQACFTGEIILLQKKSPSASLFHWGNYSSAEEIP